MARARWLLCSVAALLWLASAGPRPVRGACPTRAAAGCACSEGGARLDCRSAALRRLPPLHDNLLTLDVSNNSISTLARDALLPAAGLRDLNLSMNRLESVSSGALGGAALERLWLDHCALSQLHMDALFGLHHLHFLSVEDNFISELVRGTLQGCRALRTLRLARNLLRDVPTYAIASLHHLHTLNLEGNLISELSNTALPPLKALHTLVLKKNHIAFIEESAFRKTPALRVLRLEENLLSTVPAAVRLLPLLEDLSLASNRVEVVEAGILQACQRLARLELRGNPLAHVHAHALTHLPNLTTLVLSDARSLRMLPSLNGTLRLRTLRVDRALLARIPADLCAHVPQLRSLDVKLNMLQRVPDLHDCAELGELDLSGNEISLLDGGSLRGLQRLHDLLLAHNRVRRLPADVFTHTPALQVLNLDSNLIEHIDMETFVPISKLKDLNVGNNVFPWLPGAGLQHLLHLKVHNNSNLRHFLPPDMLPRIQTLVLSYAYLCCEFLPLMEETEEELAAESPSDLVNLPPQHIDPAAWANTTDIWSHYLNTSELSGAGAGAVELGERKRKVQCLPLPDPFFSCANLFNWWILRCAVWVMILLALIGNGTVLFVFIFSRNYRDVPRFLVTNLATADFFMGIYLGFLAVVDAGTLGEFRAHAIAWQMSGGCKLAGFLGVLSTELSVFTLAVITLERCYVITHTIHVNKRLSQRYAAVMMAVGWAFSLTAAALPLLGVSEYLKFAVCLPFETSTPVALGYVTVLLVSNSVAFLVLLGCYLKMYCAIRDSQSFNTNESQTFNTNESCIAKRMALPVLTAFLCWSPITFFALTKAFGMQLVSLEQAKVVTVFVLPLNSCCNPFLYTIFTKQFKKDCEFVCKAIEEPLVACAIGRNQHSSNFSNRQTGATTISLAERSTHGGDDAAPEPCCLLRWLYACGGFVADAPRAPAYTRSGSVSLSVKFSSSSSNSERTYSRSPPMMQRVVSWLTARKMPEDSNLSSSRNDVSSGSNLTASTGTLRTWRSGGIAVDAARPRLTRQPVEYKIDTPTVDEAPGSPSAVAPRPLHTLPSAADTELQQDEAPGSPSAVAARPLHTLPSAADTELQQDEAPGSPSAVAPRPLHTLPSAADTELQQDEAPDSPSAVAPRPLHTLPSAADTELQQDEAPDSPSAVAPRPLHTLPSAADTELQQDEAPGSPSAVAPRPLHTLPSAADTELQQDEAPGSPSAVAARPLHTLPSAADTELQQDEARAASN